MTWVITGVDRLDGGLTFSGIEPPTGWCQMKPAQRLAAIQELLCPKDEDGEPCPPLISREEAFRLLGLPYDG